MKFKDVTDKVLLTYTNAGMIAGTAILDTIKSKVNAIDLLYEPLVNELLKDETMGIQLDAVFGIGEGVPSLEGTVFFTPNFEVRMCYFADQHIVILKNDSLTSSTVSHLLDTIDSQSVEFSIKRALDTSLYSSKNKLLRAEKEVLEISSPSDDSQAQLYFDTNQNVYSFFTWSELIHGNIHFLQDVSSGLIYILDNKIVSETDKLRNFQQFPEKDRYLTKLSYLGNNKVPAHIKTNDSKNTATKEVPLPNNLEDLKQIIENDVNGSASEDEDTDFEPSKPLSLKELSFVDEINPKNDPFPTLAHNNAMIIGQLTLNRSSHNNLLIYGKPGVGKTALVTELAYLLNHNKNLPTSLLNKKIYAVNAMSLLAGTSLRGQAEERVNQLIQLSEKEEGTILFFDEIQSLINMDKGKDTTGIFDYLRPALGNGNFQVIGTTTDTELGIIESDNSLKRRFSFVEMKEPTEKETFNIVKSAYPNFSDAIINDIIRLSSENITNRSNPDRALDLASGLVSNITYFHPQDKQYIPTHTDILKALSRIVGFDVDDHIQYNGSTFDALKSHIYGQDKALKDISIILDGIQMGIRSPHHPLGSILMFGSSGVGKTETAQTIAKLISQDKDAYLKIDMSEFSSYDALYQMIGSRSDPSDMGILGTHLSNHKKAVILFDEFDKAVPFVRTVLLQILDNAKFNTGAGIPIDVSDALILVTTNAGDDWRRSPQIGFSANGQESPESKLLESSIPPELIGRFDKIVEFNPLDANSLGQIAYRELNELQKYAQQLGSELVLSDGTLRTLLQESRKTRTGARYVKSRIRELSVQQLKRAMINKTKIRKRIFI